jgi:hypothetical protein
MTKNEQFQNGAHVRITVGEFQDHLGTVDKPLGEYPYPHQVGVTLDIADVSGFWEPEFLQEIKMP